LGLLAGFKVVNVQNEAGNPVHYVACPPEQLGQLAVGATVACVPDWNRRWAFMQQHSAQHLITAVCENMFDAKTVAWGLAQSGASSLDLEIGSLSAEQLEQLELAVNDKIRSGGAVTPSWMNPNSDEFKQIRSRGVPEGVTGDIRIVTIEGVDANTCCGTHVQDLNHLQMVKLIRVERIKAGAQTRLWFAAGERCFELLSAGLRREAAQTSQLSCKPDELGERVASLLESRSRLDKECKRLTTEVVDLAAEQIRQQLQSCDQKLWCQHEDCLYTSKEHFGTAGELAEHAAQHGAEAESRIGNARVVLHHVSASPDMERLSSLASALSEECLAGSLMVFTAGEGKDGVFVLAGPPDVVSKVGKPVAELLEGRGGGRSGKFQGKCSNLGALDKVKEYLCEQLAMPSIQM